MADPVVEQATVRHAGQRVVMRQKIQFGLLAQGNQVEQVVTIGDPDIATVAGHHEAADQMLDTGGNDDRLRI